MHGAQQPEPTSRSGEKIIKANGVDLCVQTFGDPGNPAMLLVGNSMLSWEDDFCEQLAAGRRFVVRYDIRDSGRSVSSGPGGPHYTLRDLVEDAAGLLDSFSLQRAHIVGLANGGWTAQLLALDHPARVASLNLIATRPTAPGPADPDLPEHTERIMAFFMGAKEPDWSDRGAVIDYLVAIERQLAGSHGFDEECIRDRAGNIFDRAVGSGANIANHASIHNNNVFAAIDCGPRWRERLADVSAPTLVIHGAEDPFFPRGNGVALAQEIPGARLVTLDRTGAELPPHTWDIVIPGILRHTESH